MSLTFDPHWNIVSGLTVTFLLGLTFPWLMKRIAHNIGDIEAPIPEHFLKWFELLTANSGGFWIGQFERPMFFAFFWVPSLWPLVGAWLVMKTAFYWQGTNYAAFPPEAPVESKDMSWLVAKRKIGSYYAATALAGTAANIVFALVGVAFGRWIHFSA